MRLPFTKLLSFTCVVLLGACGSLPGVPGIGGARDVTQRTEELMPPVEATEPGAQTAQRAALPVVAVPVPDLNPGTQALFDRAVSLMQDGQYAAAEVLFQEITSDQPELAGPWVNLGYIHMHSGEIDAAEYNFGEALKANPRNCDALNQLGVIARRAGRFADAEKHYTACIDANPNYANAHLNLAILYELYMGRLGEALAAYNEYQLVLPEPDKKVGGWMMDLERRVAAIAKR